MRFLPSLATILVAGALISCGGDSLGPAAGAVRRSVTDPVGDTYGLDSVTWDITGLTIARDTTGVTVQLDFSRTLVSPESGDSNAMIAFVEFDTDQDSTTGFTSTVDDFRPNLGSTGMGAEYQLSLVSYAPDSSVPLFNQFGVAVGRVKPVFSGKRVTVRIPREMLGGDDGFLNAASIVGTLNSPSDIIPETGHLQLDPAASASVTWLPRLLPPASDIGPARLAGAARHLPHAWPPPLQP